MHLMRYFILMVFALVSIPASAPASGPASSDKCNRGFPMSCDARPLDHFEARLNGQRLIVDGYAQIKLGDKIVYKDDSPGPLDDRFHRARVSNNKNFAVLQVSFNDGEDISLDRLFILTSKFDQLEPLELPEHQRRVNYYLFMHNKRLHYWTPTFCRERKSKQLLKTPFIYRLNLASKEFEKLEYKGLGEECLPQDVIQSKNENRLAWVNLKPVFTKEPRPQAQIASGR